MPRFPADAPREKVIKTLALVRENADGSRTPLTLPNQRLSRGPRCGRF